MEFYQYLKSYELPKNATGTTLELHCCESMPTLSTLNYPSHAKRRVRRSLLCLLPCIACYSGRGLSGLGLSVRLRRRVPALPSCRRRPIAVRGGAVAQWPAAAPPPVRALRGLPLRPDSRCDGQRASRLPDRRRAAGRDG